MAVSLNDLGAFVGLASFVQQLGENYYRASDAVNQFRSDVTIIKGKCEAWEERARTYGLSSDPSVREALDEAQKDLQKEKMRLEHLQNRLIHRCFFKLRGTAFPLQLGQSFQRLLQLDERILGDWRADEIGKAEAQKRAEKLARAPTFAFRRDDHYVRLPEIEREIRDALEDPDGSSSVVLLHGPPGTGKSCMARHLALEYEDASIKRAFAAESSMSMTIDSCPPFEKVLYMECGDKVEAKVKQGEMLDSLGWKRERLEPEVGAGEAKSEVNLSRLLKQFLKERRILIILDDVWEKEFLEDIEKLCGQHVKILVTSQSSRLCDRSSLEDRVNYISMDRITREAAGDILKVHARVRLQDQIARPIQECMDSLVDKVSMNPHALASVATAIDRRRAHDLIEWQNAIHEYDNYLATKNTLSIHGITYPSSVDGALQVKFQRLDEQERRLVILLTMLQGPSVPEPVVQLFFNQLVAQQSTVLRRSSTQFSKCRGRLEDLHCIKVDEVDKQYYWSIHFLDSQHVQKTMKDITVNVRGGQKFTQHGTRLRTSTSSSFSEDTCGAVLW